MSSNRRLKPKPPSVKIAEGDELSYGQLVFVLVHK